MALDPSPSSQPTGRHLAMHSSSMLTDACFYISLAMIVNTAPHLAQTSTKTATRAIETVINYVLDSCQVL